MDGGFACTCDPYVEDNALQSLAVMVKAGSLAFHPCQEKGLPTSPAVVGGNAGEVGSPYYILLTIDSRLS